MVQKDLKTADTTVGGGGLVFAVPSNPGTSEVITPRPRPITPTFGYTKEKLRRTMWVLGFTTCGRDVSWWRVVGRGLVGGGGVVDMRTIRVLRL